MTKRIAIVTVPYVTSMTAYSHARETLESLRSSEHTLINIAVINKLRYPYSQKLRPFYKYTIHNDKNNLARAWNKGIRYAMREKFDYILLPNLDVISAPNTIDLLVQLAEREPEALMWCAHEITNKKLLKEYDNTYDIRLSLQAHSFSYFMIDSRLFKEVGEFDERFEPAYFEDWDMRDRILASGNYIIRGQHIPFYHYGNSTRQNDRKVAASVVANFKRNGRLYSKKYNKLMKELDFSRSQQL